MNAVYLIQDTSDIGVHSRFPVIKYIQITGKNMTPRWLATKATLPNSDVLLLRVDLPFTKRSLKRKKVGK